VSPPDDPAARVTPATTAELLAAGTVTVIHVRDAIVGYALSAPGGPTGTFADRDGEVPW
jgi:hypothetical protein